MDTWTDPRIVLTLDAGGTNFVFSAVQGNREIVTPITLPSRGDDLTACLGTIVEGFSRVRDLSGQAPVAISFAFPGPADYPAGIIGDLWNLPAFRGGVALGPMLADRFGIPVFINNDGDLFAYGEAIAGFLPYVNDLLGKANSPKRFQNLFGATFGTGFGGGIVRQGKLYLGDNSAGAEVWCMRNKLDLDATAEEGVSIRAVRRIYAQAAGIPIDDSPEPKLIYEIGLGRQPGHREGAQEAFRRMGELAGDTLANVTTLLDALVVIGGGLSGAASLFLPALVAEMNGTLRRLSGESVPRMEVRSYNLENLAELAAFLKGDVRQIAVPGTQRTVPYDPVKRIGVGISRLGTSRATAVGAYAYALDALGE